MTIPTKSLKNGFTLPVYGLGTWQMGGRTERDPSNDDERDIAAIRDAIAHGVTHIDTAEKYAEGYAELLVGRAIRDVDRGALCIASKVHGSHLSHDDVLRACEQTLQRLDTSYLDLYMVHRFNPDTPLEETMRAMNSLVDRGLVRAIGVSNFTKEHCADAQKLLHYPLACNQVHYNLRYREPEITGLLEYCQTHDIFLVAWRPLEKSDLLSDVPQEQCERYNASAAQIAINWLISQPNVVTLAKTSSTAHLEENIDALSFTMDHDDIEHLRTAFINQQSVSNIVPLG